MKAGIEIPEPSRLELQKEKKKLVNNFALSDAVGPLNRRGVVGLPLLRRLLLICRRSRKPGFSEVMESFILLVYKSLAASRILLQNVY